jgi:hypothetical protein
MRNGLANYGSPISGAVERPRGNGLRRSRFHTEKGQFAIRSARDAADAASALLTAVLRVGFGHLVPKPWVASSAFRYVRASLKPSARVFEWGAGMSTVWYDRNCAEVHAVESNAAWRRKVEARTRRAKVYLLKGTAYVAKIHEFPAGYFDLVSVDGFQRQECCRAALRHLKTGGLLVLDNTDKDRTTGGDLFRADELLLSVPGLALLRFVGWAPGNFAPQETTVCVKLPSGHWRVG